MSARLHQWYESAVTQEFKTIESYLVYTDPELAWGDAIHRGAIGSFQHPKGAMFQVGEQYALEWKCTSCMTVLLLQFPNGAPNAQWVLEQVQGKGLHPIPARTLLALGGQQEDRLRLLRRREAGENVPAPLSIASIDPCIFHGEEHVPHLFMEFLTFEAILQESNRSWDPKTYFAFYRR